MAKYLNLKPVEFSGLSAKRQAAVKWEGRLLLPKYDGCFCMVGVSNGKIDFILSRDGNAVKSMDHIIDDLAVRYPWIATRQNIVFLGEAWRPGTEFAEISGAFRRQRPQPQLGFAVFDLVDRDCAMDAGEPYLYSDQPYHARLQQLIDCRPGLCNAHPPMPVYCDNEAHAVRYAKKLKESVGYDGCVAGDPEATYTVSDGHGEFLKVKPLQSFTLEVVAVQVDVGEKTGRATLALVVRFKDKTCKVGTGFSNHEAAHWGAHPAVVVGKFIEVACMGVYPGPDGMMREPRFMGFRDDVLKPDY